MRLTSSQLSKRYGNRWILRDLTAEWAGPGAHAILGPNGSGKSTLLLLLAGLTLPTKGTVAWEIDGKPLKADRVWKHLSLATPAMELLEELTLRELIVFHFGLRELRPGLSMDSLPELWQLSGQEDKQIGSFSSGMRQRVKLGLAFATATPFLFLDEPTAHLDEDGKAWFHAQLAPQLTGRLVLIASNDPQETAACTSSLRLELGPTP